MRPKRPTKKRSARARVGRKAFKQPTRGAQSQRDRPQPPRIHTGRPQPLRIQWKMASPAPPGSKEARRFFKVETLAGAAEKLIHEGDRFIVPSILQSIGPSPLVSMIFELVHENHYRFTFRVRVLNVKRKRGSFGFIVAKNADEGTTLLEAEHEHLRTLYSQAPKHVLRPFRGGHLYLPDRYKRIAKGRDIYAFVTLWPSGFHELDIGRNQLFAAKLKAMQSFATPQTDRIRRQIIGIIAETYHPGRRTGMAVSDLKMGDFAVTKPKTRVPRVKLMACRRLRQKMTPARLVHEIVRLELKSAGRSVSLAPRNPADLFQGLSDALGKTAARTWLSQYRKAVSEKKLPENQALSLEALDDLGIS